MAQTKDKYLHSGASAINRTMSDKLDESSVTVQDFGAVGDSSTNDYAAFQAAFDSGSGHVIIPKLTGGNYYAISPTLGNSLVVPAGVNVTFHDWVKYVGAVRTGGLFGFFGDQTITNPLIDLQYTTIAGSSGNNAMGSANGAVNVIIIGGNIINCPRGNVFPFDGGKGFQCEGANKSITIVGTRFYNCAMAISIRKDGDAGTGRVVGNYSNITARDCAIGLFVEMSGVFDYDGSELSVSLSNFYFENCGIDYDGQQSAIDADNADFSGGGVFIFSRASNVNISNGTVANTTTVDAIFRGRGKKLNISNISINSNCTSIIDIDPTYYGRDESLMQDNSYDITHTGTAGYVFLSALTELDFPNRVLNNTTIKVRLTNDVSTAIVSPATRNGDSRLTVLLGAKELSASSATINNKYTNMAAVISGITTINQNIIEDSEVVTSANVITAGESGKIFYLGSVGGFASTLPAPAAGLNYTFIVKTAPTTAYTVTTNASANILTGTILDVVGELVRTASQDTINFVASTSLVGDRLHVRSDGTLWYFSAESGANGGVTTSVT